MEKKQMNRISDFVKSNKVNVVDGSVDAIDIFRQKFKSRLESEEPLYICNISDIIRKHLAWKQLLPRVIPFYGRISKLKLYDIDSFD